MRPAYQNGLQEGSQIIGVGLLLNEIVERGHVGLPAPTHDKWRDKCSAAIGVACAILIQKKYLRPKRVPVTIAAMIFESRTRVRPAAREGGTRDHGCRKEGQHDHTTSKAYKAGMMERGGVQSVRPKASGDTRAGQMNLTKRNERSTKCDAPRAGKHADTISCSLAQMARNTLWRGTASGGEQVSNDSNSRKKVKWCPYSGKALMLSKMESRMMSARVIRFLVLLWIVTSSARLGSSCSDNK